MNSFPSNPEREIITARILGYPVEQVFEAWANPDYLKNWWGPKGFTNTFNEHQFHVGGKWSFVMHGPDKGNYANECEFIAIEKPTLIAWKRYSKPLFNVVAEFEPLSDDATKVVFRMVFETAEESDKLRPYVVDKNEENFDKLEVVLAEMPTQHDLNL